MQVMLQWKYYLSVPTKLKVLMISYEHVMVGFLRIWQFQPKFILHLLGMFEKDVYMSFVPILINNSCLH